MIDADEVKGLEEVLYADGVIVNNAISGKENAPDWNAFFVKAITSFVFDDEQSIREVDVDSKYLYDHIKEDDQINDIEKALLEIIKTNLRNFPLHFAGLL